MKRNTPVERLLNEARKAIERNRFDEARPLLEAAIKHDGSDPRPWLMLAGIAPSARERRAFLAQADRLKTEGAGAATIAAFAPVEAATIAGAGATPTQFAPAPQPTLTYRAPRSPHRWPALLGGVVLLLVATLLAAFVYQRGLAGPGQNMANEPAPVLEAPPYFATPAADEAGGLAPAAGGGDVAPTRVAATEVADAAVPTSAAIAPLEPTAPVKQVVAGGALPTWTPTSQPTPTLAPTSTPTPTPEPTATPVPPPLGSPRPLGVGATEKWIDVNLTTQTLIAYEGDTPVLNVLISSGTWEHPTVTGEFRTYMKYEAQTMNGYLLGYDYFLPDVPYVMYFFNDYAIHGTYWHNNFGTPMSHGCVNTRTEDAGWLFNWAPIGTLVNVHN